MVLGGALRNLHDYLISRTNCRLWNHCVRTRERYSGKMMMMRCRIRLTELRYSCVIKWCNWSKRRDSLYNDITLCALLIFQRGVWWPFYERVQLRRYRTSTALQSCVRPLTCDFGYQGWRLLAVTLEETASIEWKFTCVTVFICVRSRTTRHEFFWCDGRRVAHVNGLLNVNGPLYRLKFIRNDILKMSRQNLGAVWNRLIRESGTNASERRTWCSRAIELWLIFWHMIYDSIKHDVRIWEKSTWIN